jgi:hypothetical protein
LDEIDPEIIHISRDLRGLSCRSSHVSVYTPLLCLMLVTRARVTRVNSANVLYEGLRIGGRATTRDSGIEIGIRRTQFDIPAVEDRYILLAI